MIRIRKKFSCDICPTERNCTQCKRYKDRYKCPLEYEWYFGKIWKSTTPLVENIKAVLLLVPTVYFSCVLIIMHFCRHIYHKFKGDIE